MRKTFSALGGERLTAMYDFCGQEEAEYDPAARKAEQDEITKHVDKINIAALIP